MSGGAGERLLTHQRLFSPRPWISKCNIGPFLAPAAPLSIMLSSLHRHCSAGGGGRGRSSAVFWRSTAQEVAALLRRRDAQRLEIKSNSLCSLCVGVFAAFQASCFFVSVQEMQFVTETIHVSATFTTSFFTLHTFFFQARKKKLEMFNLIV